MNNKGQFPGASHSPGVRRTAVDDSVHPGDEALPGSAGFQGYKLLSMCFFLQCQCRTCVSNLLSILGEMFRKPFVWGCSLLILQRNSGSWIYGKCGLNLEKHWRALTSQLEEKHTQKNSQKVRRSQIFISSLC